MLNIAPIDQHRQANGVADVRKDAFAYTYFYGLLIHKLAHFFDVVHGNASEKVLQIVH